MLPGGQKNNNGEKIEMNNVQKCIIFAKNDKKINGSYLASTYKKVKIILRYTRN